MTALRVLLVDDNPDDRLLELRELVREFGEVEGTEVGDAEGLAQALATGAVDLVVTDYSLRFTDGIAVLRAVRRHLPDCPVVMATGTGTEEIAVEAIREGLDDYVLKAHLRRLGPAARAAIAHRAAQSARVDSDRRYAELVDRLPVGVWRAAADGTIAEANAAYLEMLGYATLAELQAVSPDSYAFDVADHGRWTALAERGDVVGFLTRMPRRDGELIDVRISAHPLRDPRGLIMGYDGVIEDVTREKREAISQAFIESALVAAPIGLAIVDQGLRTSWANGAFASQRGVDRDSVLGAAVGDLLGSNGADEVSAVCRRVLETATPVLHNDVQVVVDRHARRLQIDFYPVVVRHETVGVGVVSREVTDDLRDQAQLLQSQKLEALGALAGGVAHDFNNLLGVILGYAKLLAAGAQSELERGHAERIVTAAESGADLADRLLAFGRRAPLEPRPVETVALVVDTAEMIDRLLPDGVEVDVTTPDGAVYALADSTVIRQVLIGLALNAADAMPDGGRLTIGVHEDPEWVSLAVADTGTGMDEATLRRAFEPFFTTKQIGRGTGLGLSVAYGLVQELGGTMLAESELGVGTTVTVKLASAPTPGPVREAPPPVRPPAKSREATTLMIVEDNPQLRDLLVRVAELGGFDVVSAADGLEALELCDRGPVPDVVVADVAMPRLSGLGLADALAERHPGVRVLLTSGNPPAEVAREGRPFIAKPFTPADLLDAVQKLLDG